MIMRNGEVLDGKKAMQELIGAWNTQYQQFNAASLLETKDGCNVYYTSVVGVDDDEEQQTDVTDDPAVGPAQVKPYIIY